METRDTRSAAMAAALELAMTRPAASLDDVARHAGIGRATLFRHFPNRTALLREAGKEVIASLEPRLKEIADGIGDPERRLSEVVTVLIAAGSPLHAVFAAPDLARDAGLRRAVQKLDRWIAPVVQACVDRGVLRADIDAAWLNAAFDGLLYGAWTAIREGTLSSERAAALLHETLLRGFGRRSAR